jgi:hypothetical protein
VTDRKRSDEGLVVEAIERRQEVWKEWFTLAMAQVLLELRMLEIYGPGALCDGMGV